MPSLTLSPPVPNLDLMAELTPSGTPVARERFTLTCSVTGADSLSPTYSYQFIQNNPGQTGVIRSTQPTPTLFFNNLFLEDSGQSSCDVTVTLPYLSSPHNVSSGLVNVSIQSE